MLHSQVPSGAGMDGGDTQRQVVMTTSTPGLSGAGRLIQVAPENPSFKQIKRLGGGGVGL